MTSKKKLIIVFVIGFIAGVLVWDTVKSQTPSLYDCLKLGSDSARAGCIRAYHNPNP